MNERIDHNNYEAWLLDRLEGNLSPEQELELNAFLALHPDLAPDDEGFPSLIGISASLSQEDKESIKRFVPPAGEVSEGSLDDHLIARLEGDLSAEQKLALEKFLYEHPEHEQASRLYALTKLVPQALAYVAKQELERHLPPQGNPSNYNLDDFLVARLEGDLSPEQEKVLQAYLLAHPEAQGEWAAMSVARIEAGHEAYPHKQRLKKGGKVISISFKRTALRLAAAASVAWFIGVGVWSIMRHPPGDPDAHLADQRPPAKEIEQVVTTPGQASTSEGTAINVEGAVQPEGSTGLPANDVASSLADATPSGVAPMASSSSGHTDGATQTSLEQRRTTGEDPTRISSQRRSLPSHPELERVPVQVAVAHVPVDLNEAYAEADPPSVEGTGSSPNNFGTLVASAVREKVLDAPAIEPRPLDASDAVAIVDKGLKALSGENAGLDVGRTGGRVRNFNLRVGNFAVTASTGR